MVDDAHNVISTLGFPIFAALGLGGSMWVTIRWLMRSLTESISRSREETLAQFRDLHSIQIKLIDRIRLLEDDVVRTHVLVASIHELRIPLERVGRAKSNKEP